VRLLRVAPKARVTDGTRRASKTTRVPRDCNFSRYRGKTELFGVQLFPGHRPKEPGVGGRPSGAAFGISITGFPAPARRPSRPRRAAQPGGPRAAPLSALCRRDQALRAVTAAARPTAASAASRLSAWAAPSSAGGPWWPAPPARLRCHVGASSSGNQSAAPGAGNRVARPTGAHTGW
jgi:hypothetical protein